MTQGEDLYHLQRIDSEKDAKEHRLAEVKAALGENEALQQARRDVKKTEEQARKLALKQRNLELEIESLSEKTSRSEKRLYSGKVTNPGELEDLQNEISSLKRRQQRLEDDLLEIMIEHEEAENAHEEAIDHLQETESSWKNQQANLRAERAELESRLEKLAKEREEILPSIAPQDLNTYRTLRQHKGGQAVARVQDSVCKGCGVTISSSLDWKLREGELVRCDTCGRLLVRL